MISKLEAKRQEVIDYYLSGHSFTETREHFGVSIGAVYNFLIKHGVTPRSRSEGVTLRWTPARRDRQRLSLLGGASIAQGKTWTYDRVIHKPSLLRENNPSWKGGKTPLNITIRNCPEYAQWRKNIFMRDNYTCILCKVRCQKENKIILNADHIIPLAHLLQQYNICSIEDALACQPILDINNGRTLCETCHRATDTYGLNAVHYR